MLSFKTEKGFCSPCNKPRFEICKHISQTNAPESISTKRIFCTKSHNLNCSSKNEVYLFSFKTFHEQYTGSTEEFQSRFNICRCAQKNFLKREKVKQESFHTYFAENVYHGKRD